MIKHRINDCLFNTKAFNIYLYIPISKNPISCHSNLMNECEYRLAKVVILREK